jgi:regulator of protease activity HflC (stomatin/prohibitin superfamily)
MENNAKQNEIEQSTLCCPSALSCCLASMFPCAFLCGCTTLDTNTEAVLLNYGKFMGVMRQPGCYCYNGCGTTFTIVDLKKTVVDLKNVKVADGKGNPLNLSGVVTFQIVDSKKSVLEVKNSNAFVESQGLAVMKQIASQYPYEAKSGQPSLRTEAQRLKQDLISQLQHRVEPAGVRILNFEFTDLSYAPEIAHSMLIRQQAEAKLEARKIIAEGAVEIATSAMQHLNKQGIRMSEAEQARIVGALLITLTSESGVMPTLQVGEHS